MPLYHTLHRALKALVDSFLSNFYFSECFVSHFIILFLNERDILNILQQQDSTCDVCCISPVHVHIISCFCWSINFASCKLYLFAREVNFEISLPFPIHWRNFQRTSGHKSEFACHALIWLRCTIYRCKNVQ